MRAQFVTDCAAKSTKNSSGEISDGTHPNPFPEIPFLARLHSNNAFGFIEVDGIS